MLYFCIGNNTKWHTKLVFGITWDWNFSFVNCIYYTPDEKVIKAILIELNLGPFMIAFNAENNNAWSINF